MVDCFSVLGGKGGEDNDRDLSSPKGPVADVANTDKYIELRIERSG